MSIDWARDINEMHANYEVDHWVNNNTDKLNDFLEFRLKFLEEELAEAWEAYHNNDAEEIVDAMIDLCVVAIGTLDSFGVNAHQAWDEVFRANMNKKVGVKESRPNDLGLPDLIKPTMETHGFDWVAPSHEGNHGRLFSNDL